MGAQKEPSTQERQVVALGRTLQALREGEHEDGLIETTIQYLEAEFDYALVWIALYDRAEHRLLGKGGCSPQGEVPIFKQRLVLHPGDLLEQVVIQQRPLGVPDLREETRAGDWRKTAQKLNIQGTVIFPIRHKEQCFGVVLLGSSLWGISPHSEEKARLSTILGSLAAALYQLEQEQHRQQTKQPAQPLMMLLTRLRSLPTLKQRLEAVVEETHRFIAADRTNIYWFEPQRRYFWRRVGDTGYADADYEELGITAQEINSFYQALAADQLVSVGEAHSSLKAELTGRLMQYMGAQSLVASPILFQQELLGFLAVEGTDARMWTEEEKNYVQGAAHLIALTAPLEEMEDTIRQVKQDQGLTAEVAAAIYTDDNWNYTLRKVAERVCERLQAERFLLLVYDRDLEKFEICYQTQPTNRRPFNPQFDELNSVDWHMLERSTEAIGVENLDEDLKLMTWREALLQAGVQSVLVCSTTVGRSLEGVVVVGYETARSWNRSEREILRIVSQQVGVMLHQWQLQRQTDQQQEVSQTIQWGLTTMQQIHQLDRLERSAIQQLAQLLQVPLTVLVTWQPGRPSAQIAASTHSPGFELVTDSDIPAHSDNLIQWALQADGLLPLSIDDISIDTRQWLTGAAIGQILVMTLRTSPEHEPTGIVVVADRLERYWHERQLNAMTILVSQLAWSRRHLVLTETLTTQRNKLEQLNWYKNQQIEELHQRLNLGVQRLNELSHKKDALASMRYHQIVRQLGSVLADITPLLKQEQWQFAHEYQTIPLASLLKRAVERVDGLLKQRQLWSQVHNDCNVNIGGDIPKIEFVLHEVLTSACHRSPTGSRLDIWCRPLDGQWLELSVTDNGAIEPRLLEELAQGRPSDWLAPSTLEKPPGLHLVICQAVMQQLGSEFHLYRLEDGRNLSRLVISIAANAPVRPSSLEPDL